MAAQLELEQRPFIELQIEALLHENKVKSERVEKFVYQLAVKLFSLNGFKCEKLVGPTIRHHLPLIGRPGCKKGDYPKNFEFIAPKTLLQVGSYTTGTAIQGKCAVDLSINLPPECLGKKDIKNQKFHHKRALYLSQLARLMSSSFFKGLINKLEFRYHLGDFLKPILLITPKDHVLQKKGITFQLFINLPPACEFKLSLLQPNRGNVGPRWFFEGYQFEVSDGENGDETDGDQSIKEFLESDSDATATPFYNSSILFDIELPANSKILSEGIRSHQSICDALMLIKIWLFQRGLHQHFSFVISMLVAHLQAKRAIHENMSVYQIFKVLVKFLVSSDWSNEGLSYFEDNADRIVDFKQAFPVVFLSPSGNLNMCYNISADLYERLRHEADISQRILDENRADIFELMFLQRVEFVDKFDAIAHISRITKKVPRKLEYLKKFQDFGALTPRVFSEAIIESIKGAVSDRVRLVQQSFDHLALEKGWSPKSCAYEPSSEDATITLGFLLDAETSLRIIDVGPDAKSPEAEKFRSFWGPKAQLRLIGGSISETVVWHVKNFSQRRAIIKFILDHALKRVDLRHRLTLHYTALERFIALNNVLFRWHDDEPDDPEEPAKPMKRKHEQSADDGTETRKLAPPIGVGEEVFQKVLHSYNELNKIIRSVDNLEYSITSIQPMSSHLRATGVFPPLPVGLQPKNDSLKKRNGVTLLPEQLEDLNGKLLHIEPVVILVTLEGSGKWPNKLEPLEAAKTNYLISLGEALKEQGFRVKFARDHLDILKGQFVFRVRVKCPKELNLLGGQISKEEYQKRRLELDVLPRLHAALDQLHRERPAFSLTSRLVKRWLACQLMSDHIDDAAVELIVAHLFLHPEPQMEPASSFCGFKRFLSLMASFEWRHTPLVVNFEQQFKLDELSQLKDSLLCGERSKFPPMVIVTPFDKERNSPLTQTSPSRETLSLLCKLCSKAHEYLNKDIVSNPQSGPDEYKALFRPNFKVFNLIIRLNANFVQSFFMNIDAPSKFTLSGRDRPLKTMPVVGLNLVEQLVTALRVNFGHVASFHYDPYGQRVIGVMLRPESEQMLESDDELKKFIAELKQVGAKMFDSVSVTTQ